MGSFIEANVRLEQILMLFMVLTTSTKFVKPTWRHRLIPILHRPFRAVTSALMLHRLVRASPLPSPAFVRLMQQLWGAPTSVICPAEGPIMVRTPILSWVPLASLLWPLMLSRQIIKGLPATPPVLALAIRLEAMPLSVSRFRRV